MEKTLIYRAIMMVVTVFMVTACSSNDIEIPEIDNIDDGTVKVKMSLNLGPMQNVRSRALADTPSEGLNVTILEYTWGDNINNRFINNVYQATVTSATTGVNNNVIVNTEATFYQTSEPRILHIIVTDADLGEIPYGSVSSIIQTMSVSGTQEAYWGKVELENGYGTETFVINEETGQSERHFEVDEDLPDLLSNIPVIRNFAKISCQSTAANFTIVGWDLINVPTAGTIGPWNSVGEFVPDLLTTKTNDDGSSSTIMKPYSDVLSTYTGFLSPASTFTNTAIEASEWGTDHQWTSSDESRYMYEHPYVDLASRTYLIVAGRYNNAADITYYKIDIGSVNEENNMFNVYSILRNYHYIVTINSVARGGYTSVDAAIKGMVFNNLSASTETRDMLSLSDGTDQISVNMTRAIIVNEEPITFRYCYRTNVGTGAGTLNNGLVTVLNLKAGSIIKEVSAPRVVGDSIEYTITPNTPTDVAQEQSFAVVGRDGLSRTITLVSHTPWSIEKVETYASSSPTRPTDASTIIGGGVGDELSIYFDLPDDLPESIFPLQFVLESNRQNIENNSAEASTMVVQTGQSMFTTVTDPRVQYVKTVTYDQYLYMTNENNQIVINEKNTDHVVRCRFRTTVALDDLAGDISKTTTDVIIYNPYFGYTTTTFTRQSN